MIADPKVYRTAATWSGIAAIGRPVVMPLNSRV
jgi:hypothetical protein